MTTIVMTAPSVRYANSAFRKHFKLPLEARSDIVVSGGEDSLYRLSLGDMVAEVTIIRHKPVQIHDQH